VPDHPSSIAVIDDDESMCQALSCLLSVAGYDVRTYFSAESFLNDPAHERANFVVADIQLRGMSGFDLQQRLRQERPALPVAFITAYDEAEIRAQAGASGCVAYLRKPFPGSALLEAIRSAIGSEPERGAPLVTVTATVQAIDQEKREVTLKGPLGNVVTFVVDERVGRLNEVKIGDEVTADYYVSLAGELSAPTEQEKSPHTVLDAAARAPENTSPAGGKLRAFKVVARVVGLDLPTQSVTLQSPLGNYATIRAASVDNLKKLRLGDTIVGTYTEALAISLQKTEHETKKN